ncbi:MAG: hypothetical protein GX786_10585, partial [Clostridiales bacterium]|nr:hypothetical protein [Clostridiales bacterium]
VVSLLICLITFSAYGGNYEMIPSAQGFAAGSGTAQDPYLITTAQELAYFEGRCNAGDDFKDQYIRLENHIRLNQGQELVYAWKPIGYYHKTRFHGTFDGNGYTISGIFFPSPDGGHTVTSQPDRPWEDRVNNAGLFAKGGVIGNLTVSGLIERPWYPSEAGKACGIACSAEKIENCTSYMTFFHEKDGYSAFYNGLIWNEESMVNCRDYSQFYTTEDEPKGNHYYNGVVDANLGSGTPPTWNVYEPQQGERGETVSLLPVEEEGKQIDYSQGENGYGPFFYANFPQENCNVALADMTGDGENELIVMDMSGFYEVAQAAQEMATGAEVTAWVFTQTPQGIALLLEKTYYLWVDAMSSDELGNPYYQYDPHVHLTTNTQGIIGLESVSQNSSTGYSAIGTIVITLIGGERAEYSHVNYSQVLREEDAQAYLDTLEENWDIATCEITSEEAWDNFVTITVDTDPNWWFRAKTNSIPLTLNRFNDDIGHGNASFIFGE